MKAALARSGHLIERLPPVRGRYRPDSPLAPITWFRVGGPAEVMFRPADLADLGAFLERKPPEIPVTVIGVASNLLVRDGGVEGVVVRLGRDFARIEIEATTVRAGAGALDINVARVCRDSGLAGLEFLSGIPGTIGGALSMNAGAYGRETADATLEAEALDARGVLHRIGPKDLGFGYRHCAVPDDWIFVSATLRGEQGSREEIAQRMAAVASEREASQPIRLRTGGSTFINPDEPEAEGLTAWELIERAGCRGLSRGAAMVSEKHCNFLINTGDASAADIEGLGEEVRRRVVETTGVTLQWEIRRIGQPLPEEAHP